MTIDNFIHRLNRSFSWFYYKHQWAEWELLIIAIIALILLLWILIRQKNAVARNTYEGRASKRSPIIGIKLEDHHHNRQTTDDIKERRSNLIAQLGGRQKRKMVAKHLESLNEQIKQLQGSLNRYAEMEQRFAQKIAELTTANETLQKEIRKNVRDGQASKQQITEAASTDDKQHDNPVQQPTGEIHQTASVETENLHDAAHSEQALETEVTESSSIELQPQHVEQKAAEQHAKSRRPSNIVAKQHQSEEISEDTEQSRDPRSVSEPLDVQKLKAIAALARQIQGYPRRG